MIKKYSILVWDKLRYQYHSAKSSWNMFRVWFYFHRTRIIWNLIVFPIYMHYENRVIDIVEKGSARPTDFIVPLRLVYVAQLYVKDDRYDYEHEER